MKWLLVKITPQKQAPAMSLNKILVPARHSVNHRMRFEPVALNVLYIKYTQPKKKKNAGIKIIWDWSLGNKHFVTTVAHQNDLCLQKSLEI